MKYSAIFKSFAIAAVVSVCIGLAAAAIDGAPLVDGIVAGAYLGWALGAAAALLAAFREVWRAATD